MYPPFAAILMIPWSELSVGTGLIIWNSLSLLALFGSAWIVSQRMPSLSAGAITIRPWLLAPIISAISMITQPYERNFTFGQINIFMMLLILIDTSLGGTRWCGLLTGLATGIKVLPGIFIVLMLLNRRWADAARAGAVFVATLLIGLALGIDQQLRYWSDFVFGLDEIFNPNVSMNVGLQVAVLRWVPDPLAHWIWIFASIVIVIGGLWVAAAWHKRDALVSVSAASLVGLLISPLSWNYHWVWLMPVGACVVALYLRTRGQRASWWLLAALIVIAAAAFTQVIDSMLHSFRQAYIASALGSLYVLCALLTLVALAMTVRLVDSGASSQVRSAP